jgi:hypothetical protein
VSFVSTAGARMPHGPVVAPPIPDLLLHFDGNFIDSTGNSTFTVGGTTGGTHTSDSPTYEASAAAAFGQVAVTTANSGAWATSTLDMSIATKTSFTLAGWNVVSATSGPGSGGVLFSKSFFSSDPSLPSGFMDWWMELVYSGGSINLILAWNAGAAGRSETVVLPVSPSTTRFHWAIVDDGTDLNFYCNGSLVETRTSVYLHASPPVATAAQVIMFNRLQGFLGADPNWYGQGFTGKTDEFAIFFNEVVYTGASYTVPSAPYTVG